MQRLSPTSPFLASIFTFVSAFSLGCVITLGGGGDDAGIHECGSLLANNDANCVCLAGYERCNPNDPNDTDCCEKEGKGDGTCEPNSYLEGGQCFCDPGYAWCNPNDDNDLTCCEDPGQTSQGTGGATESGGSESTSGSTTETAPTTSAGTSGGPVECNEAVEPPANCNPDDEFVFCSNPESCGPEGSKHYICEGGVWVENPSGPDENCAVDGYDFGYGCTDNGQMVEYWCGYGSGEACNTNTPATCDGTNTLVQCAYGKQSETDCFKLCTEGDGMGSPTYDFGDCQVQDGEAVCACCDEGDPGCEMGGTSTGGDTSTSG